MSKNKHKSNIHGIRNNNTRLLPFHVIEAAASGDEAAINKVLKHYEGYIIVLSTREFYDEYGNTHFFVDNEVRRTLETRLILKILQFDTAA
jgi:hypothetical protein